VSDAAAFPRELEVLIELPRWGFVKRDDSGRIDLLSPLPCPFNYGSVPGSLAPDGQREDALVLGPRLPTGSRQWLQVLGRVRFVDAGLADPKWVCGRSRLSARERISIDAFFNFYARVKRLVNAARGLPGPTHYAGLELANFNASRG
jgi:inorganic pyrophosphatase